MTYNSLKGNNFPEPEKPTVLRIEGVEKPGLEIYKGKSIFCDSEGKSYSPLRYTIEWAYQTEEVK